MAHKRFLVLGHPRSGTGFMSLLMKEYGYQVGHEVMGTDGISSWMFAVKDYQIFTDNSLNKKDFQFEYTIMNLRHPLDIISSSYFTEDTNKPSMDYRKRHLQLDGLNKVEMTVKSVLEWYRIIELQRPNLKICIDKDPEEKMYYFLRRFENIPLSEPIPKIERKINTRNHAYLTFADIKEQCSKGLVSELEDFCYLYGYKIEE